MAERPPRHAAEALVAERDFLLASLEDLDREYAAGDLDEEDYQALRASYVERTTATLRAIEMDDEVPATPMAAPAAGPRRLRRYLGRSRTRKILLVAVVLCLLGSLTTTALSLAGVRLAGQSATGSVDLPANESIAQQLSAASVLGSEGQLTQAISLYDAVLAREAHNAEALTYRSWLIRITGVAASSKGEVRAADTGLAEAVQVAPGYAAARAFYGLAMLEDGHNATGAARQFQAYLADEPPAALRTAVGAEIAQAYLQAKIRVPQPFVQYLGSVTGTSAPGAG